MSKFLTPAEKDFHITDLAKSVGVEPAVMMAIVNVESRSSGFYKDGAFAGKCVVRFEADWFEKKTGTRPNFIPATVSIVQAKNNAQYNGRAAYEKACIQNADAAIHATSFGLGQIMGFHYADLGYVSYAAYANTMETGEYEQLEAMIKFMRFKPGLIEAARLKDFTEVAKKYNGRSYLNYVPKLIAEYAKLTGGKVLA